MAPWDPPLDPPLVLVSMGPCMSIANSFEIAPDEPFELCIYSSYIVFIIQLNSPPLTSRITKRCLKLHIGKERTSGITLASV